MGKKKFVGATDQKIGVIADEDTVAGMVLAGIGHIDGNGRKNFLVVDSKTHIQQISEKFHDLTTRKDIAMIFITQGCADQIRTDVTNYCEGEAVIPTVLEIPSKEQPYNPHKDPIMQRVSIFLPAAMELFDARK
jgi:V-type H+-transporting ATPase subunit F